MQLFPEEEQTPLTAPGQTHATGILPAHGIRNMIRDQQIWAVNGQKSGVLDDQIQPASLDLRLGDTAYRIRASFLPGVSGQVMQKLETLAFHKIDLTDGAVLETGCVYLVPLMEALALPERTGGFANPKSSTGRIDVFTRVITDFGVEFDKAPPGYKGHLYLEVSPRTFPILVRAGSRLSQIRFRRGNPAHSDAEIKRLHQESALVDGHANIDGGLALSIDLAGDKQTGLIGYRAKRHAGLIDVDRVNALPLNEYWEPIYNHGKNQLILDPDEFYILASRESVTIPPTHAAEMVPFNPLVGEFRVHYAGFFDPGFGAGLEGKGSRAVLEVRSREVPFILEHGQIIGRLIYERLTDRPEVLYGKSLESNYQRQGLRLSKHFIQD
ncbi:putative salicylate hydroxylase Salicylate 1-monooxygenase protein [Candidatus Micropelagos thuwalensis]|uniref:Putative salicylate hydroxylase Salicylate 1-monooxygenase protein n=1 Tax=Candidatus Micropelagius thuwalensis TaxID=1397666 RepID=U2XP03_9PROT|nr:2'-deoxycytidine 5'-triphosphate deaminase [Candidatus Micropelagos thuwalensis]ERL46847.1 putative salicylate hydroxylase Salicylate 1-monooxygenase protein [Candidatus Micropelagos thuwalensis]